jgi:lipid-A-disaccharide synthase
MTRHLKIAIIAGEPSGDYLGAGLITAMHKIDPSITFYGIGGPLMRDLGFHALYPMEKIAVMGISDVLQSYPRLKWIHHNITRYLLDQKPDLFIGIDAPDFNLSIEKQLRAQKIKTVHYVSPKVWAWRPERVAIIKEAVDLLLSVFPFEPAFYEPYNVPISYVGHPLADLIPRITDTKAHKSLWGYGAEQSIIAVLPGSRLGEIKHMGPLFFEVMQHIQLKRPDIIFMIPVNNQSSKKHLEHLLKKKPGLNIRFINQQSREVMAAADVVLVKSGTSTLEAALLKKPMVVSFKMSALTYRIVAPKVTVPYTALPNLLANDALVPEFIQHNANPIDIAQALLELVGNHNQIRKLEEKFDMIHQSLQKNAHQEAAKSVLNLI